MDWAASKEIDFYSRTDTLCDVFVISPFIGEKFRLRNYEIGCYNLITSLANFIRGLERADVKHEEGLYSAYSNTRIRYNNSKVIASGFYCLDSRIVNFGNNGITQANEFRDFTLRCFKNDGKDICLFDERERPRADADEIIKSPDFRPVQGCELECAVNPGGYCCVGAGQKIGSTEFVFRMIFSVYHFLHKKYDDDNVLAHQKEGTPKTRDIKVAIFPVPVGLMDECYRLTQEFARNHSMAARPVVNIMFFPINGAYGVAEGIFFDLKAIKDVDFKHFLGILHEFRSSK